MFSFLRWFLKTTLISAVVRQNQCFITAHTFKRGRRVRTNEAVFDIVDGKIEPKFLDFLQKREKEAYFSYFAILLQSQHQWALPAISKEGFKQFEVDFASVQTVNINNKWSIMVSKTELQNAPEFWLGVEADFVFSPFALLHRRILDHEIQSPTLYIYNATDFIAMIVQENGQMLFAAYFNTTTSPNIGQDDSAGESLETINIADIENILEDHENEGFSQLESLDSISSAPDLSDLQEMPDLGELGDIDEGSKPSDKAISDSANAFADIDTSSHISKDGKQTDLERINILITDIRVALSEFYKNKIYKADFITNIMIYDDMSLDIPSLGLIETEFLMSVDLKTADMTADLSSLMMQEFASEL